MKLSRLVLLIAEDDENDIVLFRRAIEKTGIPHELHFVRDGEAAKNWLQGSAQFCDRTKHPFPNLLITDLKMPKMSGIDLLRWLCEHEHCSVIPTIVFSSSEQNADIKETFRLGANSYFTKPANVDSMSRLFKLIFEYWFASEVPEPPLGMKCQ